MATQPKIPESRQPVQPPQFPVEKKQFPWPLVILVVAAAILALLLFALPRAPRAKAPPAAAQVPQQPTGHQIELSELKIVPEPTGGAFYLTGQLMNTGNTSISGIEAEIDLQNSAGQTLIRENLPVESVMGNPPREQFLVDAPIKPQEKRVFRIHVSEVPAGWNHQVPQVKILDVTGSS